ncbi:hypothetical protein [Sinobaca sp. H24]|uniref:hypothetical protein n=1 Tax=Sinobaca sp. H24 TaxID=2923376 RepID=UPI00207AB465|nr:hypothetical protein [Sinobaca sp. H24]
MKPIKPVKSKTSIKTKDLHEDLHINYTLTHTIHSTVFVTFFFEQNEIEDFKTIILERLPANHQTYIEENMRKWFEIAEEINLHIHHKY